MTWRLASGLLAVDAFLAAVAVSDQCSTNRSLPGMSLLMRHSTVSKCLGCDKGSAMLVSNYSFAGPRPLVVIPGLTGNATASAVRDNLRLLREDLGHAFACLLFVTPPGAQDDPALAAESFAPCRVVHGAQGAWGAVKAVAALDLEGFSCVLLLHEDRRLEASTLAKLQAVMDTEAVDMASATHRGGAPETTASCDEAMSLPGLGVRGSFTADFGVSLLRVPAFRCLQRMAAPAAEDVGGENRSAFPAECGARVALCDACITEHVRLDLGRWHSAIPDGPSGSDPGKSAAALQGCSPKMSFSLPGGSSNHSLLLASVHLSSVTRGQLHDELSMLSPGQLLRLHQIEQGRVPKSEVEVVLAQHDEDVSWSDVYASVRTVYCKGNWSQGCVRLPNVGREGHTYLHHIVANYHRLSQWTVFSQAEGPSDGYHGHRLGGGHMLPGVSFHDYVLQSTKEGLPGDDGAMWVFTSAMNLATTDISIRRSYQAADSMPRSWAHQTRCPSKELSDGWLAWISLDWFGDYLAGKCNIDKSVLAAFFQQTWRNLLGEPLPSNKMAFFAQGARFAASRERIQERPREFYERLLNLTAAEQDPCINYLSEWFWYYLIGRPQRAPCDSAELLALG